MTRLLAFVDGSVYSESICDHAAWIAQRDDAEVHVVHVLGRREDAGDQSNLSGSIGPGARSALLEELADLDAQRARLSQKRGRAILIDAEKRLNTDGVTAVTTLLRNGEVARTMQDMESEADLIIMGKRGEAANFDQLHLGANMERVGRATSIPVLVASRSFKPIKSILLAFDGGKSALKAVGFIASRPRYNDLACHLLNVGQTGTSAQRDIDGAAATLRDAGYAVTTELLPGQPETVISQYVEANSIDLVIMGAYGHSRIRNLIIGSTTTEMLRSCKVPVLLFR